MFIGHSRQVELDETAANEPARHDVHVDEEFAPRTLE
jgi:hypothetical protein